MKKIVLYVWADIVSMIACHHGPTYVCATWTHLCTSFASVFSGSIPFYGNEQTYEMIYAVLETHDRRSNKIYDSKFSKNN